MNVYATGRALHPGTNHLDTEGVPPAPYHFAMNIKAKGLR
jgi:hypothetical protein